MAMATETIPDVDYHLRSRLGHVRWRRHEFFAGYGGGTDANLTDNTELGERLRTLTGVDMTGVNAVGRMIDGHMTDTPTGIVATNAEGPSFGMVAFLGMEAVDVMTAYNMTAEQYGAVAGWVAGWATFGLLCPTRSPRRRGYDER